MDANDQARLESRATSDPNTSHMQNENDLITFDDNPDSPPNQPNVSTEEIVPKDDPNPSLVVSTQEIVPKDDTIPINVADDSGVPTMPTSSDLVAESTLNMEKLSLKENELPSTESISGSHNESPPIPTLTMINPSDPQPEKEQEYILKEIVYCNRRMRIMTQNENGPCPLIAVVNSLILQDRLSFDASEFKVSASRVMTLVANRILDKRANEQDETGMVEANVEAALRMLQKSLTGIDVNPRFKNINDFEFTESITFFDVLNIPLYHGWIPDDDMLSIFGNRGYNELVEAAFGDKDESVFIKQWLDDTASQLTCLGIDSLLNELREGQVAILFRNNHFHNIVKDSNRLYILVTDFGYIRYPHIIFEALVDVKGHSYFTNGKFENLDTLNTVSEVERDEESIHHIPSITHPTQIQVDNDYALALSLAEEERYTDDNGRNRRVVAQPLPHTERRDQSQHVPHKNNKCSIM